jgi:transposase
MQVHSVGIDLSKTAFHLVAQPVRCFCGRSFSQKQFTTFTANMQTSSIGWRHVQERTSLDVCCANKAMT